jgi:hypothetical protein
MFNRSIKINKRIALWGHPLDDVHIIVKEQRISIRIKHIINGA